METEEFLPPLFLLGWTRAAETFIDETGEEARHSYRKLLWLASLYPTGHPFRTYAAGGIAYLEYTIGN